MDALTPDWFTEMSPLFPGQGFSLQVQEVLYSGRSDFQDILVFQSKTYGRVLALDGVIQCTERDEFAYQEMMAHLPLTSHPLPENVLIVGGGDGGVLREVVKHPEVKHVTLCEIDKEVTRVAKLHLPWMTTALDHPKVTVVNADGSTFLQEKQHSYDVIITDGSDPIGPAKSLFEENYYELLKQALKPGGVICQQTESPWLFPDFLGNLGAICRRIYPEVRLAVASMPTYPCGEMGYLICSLHTKPLNEPQRVLTELQQQEMGLRFYTPEMHRAVFTLPSFAHKIFYGSNGSEEKPN
uniref:spermidine synthase-like n=1 Tax=Myxine glutinosa TaxID=7769 RepID=UPI00358E5B50